MDTSPASLTSPSLSPLPSPLLLPLSPRSSKPSGSTTTNNKASVTSSQPGPQQIKMRAPNININTNANDAAKDTTTSPARILPSTSTISLLSLSFSKANLASASAEDDTIDTVLEESGPQASQHQGQPQTPQSPKQPIWRKPAGHLTPTSSFTSSGQYLNSAQHRRVSHYITGISGSPTSVSRRGSSVNLSQLGTSINNNNGGDIGSTGGSYGGGAGFPTTPGAQIIPSKSRRPSYTMSFQSPGQHQMPLSSPMYSNIPPDSPSLGPISLCSSPTKLFLAQTPPVLSQFPKHWVTNSNAHQHPSNVIDIIQEGDDNRAEEAVEDNEEDGNNTVKKTAAAIAAALESEISNNEHNHTRANSYTSRNRGHSSSHGRRLGDESSTPISIPRRENITDPGSPELGPVATPLETAPMTPMALDLHSQNNSHKQNQVYFARLHQLQQRQHEIEAGNGIMETLRDAN